MKVYKDYHIHCILPNSKHAKSTIEEIIKVAIKKGLKEIAITNHGINHIFFGLRKKHVHLIKNEILRLREIYPEIKILMGIESNIISMDGSVDLTKEIIEKCDILLCGYHIGVKYKTINDYFNFIVLNFFAKKFGLFRARQIKINTEAVVRALDNNKIAILTHPGDKLIVDMNEIAKAAQRNGTILEINNSHTHLNEQELIICEKYDVKYIINSDAHINDKVGTFEKALNRAIVAKIDLNKIINLER